MMSSLAATKPHAVCIPIPFQGHIIAMLKFAKLLHCKGFHITFVNTEYNHQRILKSRGPDSLKGLPDFQFETIPDGLAVSDINVSQDILALCVSTTKNFLGPFLNLIAKLNKASADSPPVTCIISDIFMSFPLEAAKVHGIPSVLLCPVSACVLMIYLHCQHLAEKGLVPVKDKSDLTDGYLNKPIDSIPGVRDIRLKDIPSFFWDDDQALHNYFDEQVQSASKASAIIFNTFDALENSVLEAMRCLLPPIYTMGPLPLLLEQLPQNTQLRSVGSNLWKENEDCIPWLNTQELNSVVYVNFGSTTVMTSQQLNEFAWGLANSKHPFLWVIRPDLVIGEAAILPPQFTEETAERGLISGWCPQEQVLMHSSIGGFLTHSGWNSTMDAICGSVPILSWPFFGDQQTNSRNACVNFGIGMEIDYNVKRDDVEGLVRELMEGEKGKGMKEQAMVWKKSAEDSAKPAGSSYVNLDKIIKEVLTRTQLE
ncbi:hypothetical protein IFM89_006140 [Coptis chinensis]|uniref:Glycosyltransferase n=1 Tax=Coptis chinensis TaxID=261450 RepID=A0A835GW29_9MAGN|nr:hypothetical protein IFM89_006140 [Coptis chinensis]